ncbi:MAG: hypothetical protein ABFR36_01500 [Acidobacteriota bacterium]
MKNIISIIVLIIVGLFAYNHFNKTYTADEQYLMDLESDFNDASKLMTQSERASATAGLDTTTSFEQGIETIRDVRRDLIDFINDLPKDQKNKEIVEKANILLDNINSFLSKQGYPSEPE